MHDLTFGQMSRCQTSLAVKGPAVKCHLRSSFSNLGCRSKIRGQMSLRSNVLGSNVPRSNVTCGQVFLILVADQKSHGQMSLRSNVPRSNDTCGQMSRGQMSLEVICPAVKCRYGQMSQNLELVKSPWSNVPWSNETVVIEDPIV